MQLSIGERISRVVVLTLGIFILSQMWAQMALELHFPLAVDLVSLVRALFSNA
jgi:hypothetical protein